MNKLIIVSGATATGKTDTAINIAKSLSTPDQKIEVINFDSLVFYKELTIGTAKPTPEEQNGINHHLVGSESIFAPLNASEFVIKAEPIIKDLHNKNIVPVLVGGSAFYIRALIKGMYESTTVSSEIRKKTEEIFEKEGIEYFIKYLKEHDPASAEQLHQNDHYRVIRAVEHHMETGTKISSQKEELDKNLPYDFSHNPLHPDWDVKHIYLEVPKPEHLEIIESRAKKMVNAGLIEEVTELLDGKASGNEKPLLSIGYKETQDYIAGRITEIDGLLERISISTRQLAKSQKTFFKKIVPKSTFNPLTDKEALLAEVKMFLEQ